MKWIWIRHGETDLNGRGCYLGHTDVPLNDKGFEQVERLLEGSWSVTSVYSSDLLRCKQTAERIVGGLQEIHYTSALRELHFGDWEGRRYEELMKTDAHLLTAWYQDPFTLSPPHGESLQQLGCRMDHWLFDALSQLSDDDTILVVTHGGPLRWMLSHWLLGDARRFWDVQGVRHGEGFVVELDDGQWGEPQFFGGEG